MPDIFDSTDAFADGSAEYVEALRAAYIHAMAKLSLIDGASQDRVALVGIIQEIARTEVSASRKTSPNWQLTSTASVVDSAEMPGDVGSDGQ